MRRFTSGTTDQYLYFVAVDATDLKTRETGLTTFTVYRARNGAAAAAYTTPTVAEVSAANMPGVYSLLLDEDMTIGSGNDSEEVVLHITQASMAPVTLIYELYRPKVTEGETLTVASGGLNAALGTGVITAGSIAADAIGASELAADAIAEIADAVWDEDATAHQTQGTFGQAIGDPGADTDTIWSLANTNLDATISSRLAAASYSAPPSSATIADAVWDEAQADHVTAGSFGVTASEIADILVDTAEIGAAGAGLTNINLPDQTMNITGNITGNLSGSVGSVTGAVGSVTGNVGGNVVGSVASVTAGVTLAASAVQAIWDALTTALTTAGSIGKLLVDNINATISSRLASAAYTAPLDAAGTRAAVGLAAADLDTQLAALPTAAENADAVWDEVLTGATHNVASSAGRRLRQLDAVSITDGTAQAGASNSITLAAGASATDEIYDGNLIVITEGTGAGQARTIVEYNGTTKVAIIGRGWEVNPDATSVYEIIAATQPDITHHGLAQAGTATTITLASTASATDDVYVGSHIYLSTSTGSGQTRLITDYDGTTKVATVSPAWAVNPGANTVYKILPIGRSIVDQLGTQAKADVNTEVVDALNTDTYAEPGQGTPGATLSLAAKIGYLYKAWRNKKTVTATTFSLFNDDAVTVDQKSTVSDAAGTFTETEKTTGP